MNGQVIEQSGELEIDIQRRELCLDGIRIPLGGRAFDILRVLVDARGAPVPKSGLMERVWTTSVVSDNALQVHIFAIRKALGAKRALLRTISGRGYRLVGNWTVCSPSGAASPSDLPSEAPMDEIHEPPREPAKQISGRLAPRTNLPEAVTGLIGRADAIERLRQACSAYRIVTLTGAGGIGKTSLGIEVARSLLPDFNAGVWLVELAPLTDPGLVPLAVMEAAGLPSPPGPLSPEAIARSIGSGRVLLLLDNCEHLIGAAASLAETIVRIAPGVVILATSRETLRIHREYVFRVPPLDVPHGDTGHADALLNNSAVRLFIDRARALHLSGLRDAGNVRLIAEICRRLDGIPLALEFAAARAASLGLAQIAAGLEDRFALLTTGRRTALPRHQTLRAVFDWSYALLPEVERQLLHRLAIFSGGFTLDAACALMRDSTRTEVEDGIVSLVEKSMVTFVRSDSTGRWRLLETVRSYGLEKLVASSDYAPVARRHAEYFLGFLSTFDPDANPDSGAGELARYTREVDNLRAALTWAFSAAGDRGLGSQLAAAAINFWLVASLLDECRNWVSKALAETAGVRDDEQEMVLRSGLGLALLFTEGMTPSTHANLTRALAIAEAIGSIEHQKRAVHAFWQISLRSVELRKALQLSRRYAEFALTDTSSTTAYTANLMVGMSLTYLAEYSEASSRLEQAIRDYPLAQRQHDVAWLGIDGPASAFGHLSTCLFARGLIDGGIHAAERSIEESRKVGQAVVLCLGLTRPAALLLPEVGALDTADRYITEIMELADRHNLDMFRALAACARGRLLFMRGDAASGAAALRSGLQHMAVTGYRSLHTIFRGYFAEAVAAIGDVEEGLVEAEAAVRFAEETEYLRFVPELMCIHGNLLGRRQPDDPEAERIFQRAIALSRQQRALYWELRAALGLADCWRALGRKAEAQALIAPIYRQFTEGSATTVLMRAKALLRATGG